MVVSVRGRGDTVFVRIKNSHGYKYLQIVESKREGKKVKQRVLTTLGQLEPLRSSGKIDDLTRSLGEVRFHSNHHRCAPRGRHPGSSDPVYRSCPCL